MTERRQLVLTIAVLVIVALWDFFGRVHVGRDAASRAVNVPSLVPLTQRPDADKVRADLVAWMPTLAGTAAAALDPADPGAWNLTLLGIFRRGGEPFGVVLVEPAGGGNPTIERFSVGDTVHGRRVAEIGPREVKLAKGDDVQKLALFQRKEPSASRSARGPSGEGVAERPRAKKKQRSQVADPGRMPGESRQRPREKAQASRSTAPRAVDPTSRTGSRVGPSASGAPDAARPQPPGPGANARARPAGSPDAESAAAPTSAAKAGVAAQQPNAAGPRVAKPVELAPGSDPSLPWNLPVVEDKPPGGGTKK